MAKDKNSFIFYTEWIETFQALSDDNAGKLIKHMLEYVNDQDPVSEDKLIELIFIPIKQALKRDLRKYENYIEKQRVNGAKGGRPKKANESQNTQAFFEEPKKADNVNVNDNVNDNDIVYRESAFKEDVFSHDYPNYLLQAFFSYWSEPTKSKKKMRYEMQKTWDTKRRLSTWASRDDKYTESVKATKRADSKIIRYD